jgi:pyridoxamine 5'-phosphate oxidase
MKSNYFDKAGLPAMRKDYHRATLDEKSVPKNPYVLFGNWFSDAVSAGLSEPNAMILATADSKARPTARVVLMKGMDENGLAFYTDYHSKKGRQLTENPFAAVVFLWKEMERQVRIEGKTRRMTAKQSNLYFQSRPEASRISATASLQSSVLKDRSTLEKKVSRLASAFKDKPVPRPERWGGFLLQPLLFEFWQGRPDRLHDRLQFTYSSGGWKIVRLSP